MQSALANTMTLSCSCFLKWGEARWQRHFAELGQWRWQRSKTHYKAMFSTRSANPASAVFILVQFSAANAKSVGQTQSKTNRRLFFIVASWSKEKRANSEPMYGACAMTMTEQKAPQTNDFCMLCTTHNRNYGFNCGTILCHSLCRTIKHDTFILRCSLNV